MVFSRPCQYAILAMTYLADRASDRRVSTREISEETEIPLPFLSKIVSTLSRHGLLAARRGPSGGVALGRAPAEVTVGDVVEAFDGPLDEGRCVLGLSECDGANPCPVHESWKRVREELFRELHSRTLADLARTRTRDKKRSKARARRKAGRRPRESPRR